jgi:tRNA uridine 5-carbamoylmethylation protein Kti12
MGVHSGIVTLYLLSGIPGSGKTTLAHELAGRNGAVVRSFDDMDGANTMENSDGSVKREWLRLIRADLIAGKNVVCDSLNLASKDRLEVLSAVSGIPCRKVLAFKVVPLNTCLERNAKREARLPDFVIEQAAQRIEPPTDAEGWDEITVYEN